MHKARVDSAAAPPDNAAVARSATSRGYAWALLTVAAATAAGRAAAPWLPAAAADLLYLIPVIAAASLYGRGAGVVAAASSAAAYNFFFTEPLHSLAVREPGDLVTVAVLLGVALVTSGLAARARAQANRAEAQAGLNGALVRFARSIARPADEATLAEAVAKEVGAVFRCSALVVGSHGRLLASAPTHGLDPLAEQAAAATLSRNVPAGRGTAEPFGSDWTFFPMGDAALGLARDDGRFPVATHEQPLLAGLLAQGALAFERARLAGEMAEVASLRERDHLRGALLSSVGHDLRTPLTTILAAAAELKARGAGDLAAAIENEGHRLDRYIADLLDMVRIEAGAIRLAIEPVDLLDVAAAAAREVAGALPPERLRIDVPPDLPLVRADARLLHHCLINLLANAAQHGGPGAVDIHAATGPDGVTLAVSDRGLGLPPGTERRIWEQFVRLEGSDRKGGTGLGLAIVSGFARAMGLGVEARNRADGQGASFQLRFPPALLVTIAAEEAA